MISVRNQPVARHGQNDGRGEDDDALRRTFFKHYIKKLVAGQFEKWIAIAKSRSLAFLIHAQRHKTPVRFLLGLTWRWLSPAKKSLQRGSHHVTILQISHSIRDRFMKIMLLL